MGRITAIILAGCLWGCDAGTVTVTCASDYTFGADHEADEYPGFTTTCDEWAEHGEQQMESTRARCEQDGLDAGADAASCTCTDDPGTCTFPNGTND